MPCSPTTPCSFVLRQEEETADTENPMLVPGMYTTVMLYGESRPTTFPSQNQHIHEPSYNPDNAWVLRPLWAHNKWLDSNFWSYSPQLPANLIGLTGTLIWGILELYNILPVLVPRRWARRGWGSPHGSWWLLGSASSLGGRMYTWCMNKFS